jgi:nickel-dependent lactate racemase
MKVPWQAWYNDKEEELCFPATWHVTLASMADAQEIDSSAIDLVLSKPIGSLSLTELAKGASKVAIVVEDISRPSPTAQILPKVLTHLELSGLRREQAQIIIATGAHLSMRRSELIKKLGEDVLESVQIFQHHNYENLKYLGHSQRGTPIFINRTFLEADLRIGVGSVTPHRFAGFGGGAKLVASGLAGMDTLHAHHSRAIAGEAGGVGHVEDNQFRADLEDIAERTDLRFVVCSVVNSRRQLAGVFAGDMIKAHRAAVAFARQVYATPIPPPADIGIFNAYPKDIDLVQSLNALNVINHEISRAVRCGGSVVMTTACPEGAGIHQWSGVGMRGYHERDFGGYSIIIYSPNLSYPEVKQTYPADRTLVFNRWHEVITELEKRHGHKASVTVFPYASLQVPS